MISTANFIIIYIYVKINDEYIYFVLVRIYIYVCMQAFSYLRTFLWLQPGTYARPSSKQLVGFGIRSNRLDSCTSSHSIGFQGWAGAGSVPVDRQKLGEPTCITKVFKNATPPDVANLAATGAHGKHAGNIHRDAFRKFKSPDTWLAYSTHTHIYI